ncbi:hypothetical protein EIN_380730 [Entamoeba invadens IP1]|uniref:Uncharacterized protein n=2 Tax=Entamoeba invadens TaxID=33085 RepID=A0A0A1UEB5_ENTIV|nr:hypothetical protein EIN_380730 [Entamoeba invadens IP1]ELP92126.1 hypothetical protein EIN_380730 [Entamoeba invadens IP1]BAN41098.1 hypothetical protein [Entamoeba invadens]|eukprot:XP_004258897.1 hypothetical protein EIN_380730 [Entamoeba invadens IP1]
MENYLNEVKALCESVQPALEDYSNKLNAANEAFVQTLSSIATSLKCLSETSYAIYSANNTAHQPDNSQEIAALKQENQSLRTQLEELKTVVLSLKENKETSMRSSAGHQHSPSVPQSYSYTPKSSIVPTIPTYSNPMSQPSTTIPYQVQQPIINVAQPNTKSIPTTNPFTNQPQQISSMQFTPGVLSVPQQPSISIEPKVVNKMQPTSTIKSSNTSKPQIGSFEPN